MRILDNVKAALLTIDGKSVIEQGEKHPEQRFYDVRRKIIKLTQVHR